MVFKPYHGVGTLVLIQGKDRLRVQLTDSLETAFLKLVYWRNGDASFVATG